MNQQQKDEAEFLEYARPLSSSNNPEWLKKAFRFDTYLAALHAERTRKSEVVGIGFEEWIKKHNPWCNKDSLYTDSDMQAAYAQGERAKEKEVEAKLGEVIDVKNEYGELNKILEKQLTERDEKIKELSEYKEMWQEIGGAANLKGLIKRNDDLSAMLKSEALLNSSLHETNKELKRLNDENGERAQTFKAKWKEVESQFAQANEIISVLEDAVRASIELKEKFRQKVEDHYSGDWYEDMKKDAQIKELQLYVAMDFEKLGKEALSKIEKMRNAKHGLDGQQQ